MAIRTGTALKQLIESFGIGLSAYIDEVPDNAVLPYCLIQDGISDVTEFGGDAGAGDTVIENCQVDLYQALIASNGHTNEPTALGNALRKRLHGSAPTSAGADTPSRIFGIRVPFMTRATSADDNTVRTRLSVDVRRAL